MRAMAKMAPGAVLLAVLLLPSGAALADAPAKVADSGKAGPTATTQAQAAKDAPLNPRWRVRSWTVSGLTVWTFRPGHFERD